MTINLTAILNFVCAYWIAIFIAISYIIGFFIVRGEARDTAKKTKGLNSQDKNSLLCEFIFSPVLVPFMGLIICGGFAYKALEKNIIKKVFPIVNKVFFYGINQKD